MVDVFDFAEAPESTVVEQAFDIVVERSPLLAALKKVSGVVENSQILQILSHIKLQVQGETLTVVATDSEVELVSTILILQPVEGTFAITVPGKKLLDMCRTLPEGASIAFSCSRSWVKIRATDSIEFTLSALPSEGFPVIRLQESGQKFVVPRADGVALLQNTAFAMAHNDVRHFLNGMLFTFADNTLKVTATDGHRLAIDYAAMQVTEQTDSPVSAIVPRKAILELVKLVDASEGDLTITVTDQHIRVDADSFVLSTRLLEGAYPDCERLIPDYDGTKAIVSRLLFKQALSRAAVLAKEKYHGVRLSFLPGELRVSSTNADNEKAEEAFPIDYEGETIVMAFNIGYLLDVVNVLTSADIDFVLSDPQKCVLLKSYGEGGSEDALYVVMPMTL